MQLLGAAKSVTVPHNGYTLFSGASLRSRRRRSKPNDKCSSSSSSGRGEISIGSRRSLSTSGYCNSSIRDTAPVPVAIHPRNDTCTNDVPLTTSLHCPQDVAIHGSVPFDTVSKSTPPHVAVRYGDTIRLFARSKYATEESDGGYVGTFEGSKRFFASKNLQKQGEIVCLPPIAPCGERQFKPSAFVIWSYNGLAVGTPVSYGDVVVLVDAVDGRIWNNKIGVGPGTKKGCFGPKEPHTPGEMSLSFYQLHTDMEGEDESSLDSPDNEDNFLSFNNLAKNMTETTFGKPNQAELHLAEAALRAVGKFIYYGDQNVIIDVADSNRLRSKFDRVITHFSKQQESTPVEGGFLRCDGRGKTILFGIHGQEVSKIIQSISIQDVTKTDVESSNAGSSDANIDDKATDESGYRTSRCSVIVSTRTDVAVGRPLLLQDLRRSMSLVIRFSNGGQVRVPCQRFLKHDGSAFYRLVLGGERPMRILARATRAVDRKKVGLRSTLRGTYRQIVKLSCSIVITYSAAASMFTHVYDSLVVLPAVYAIVAAGVMVLLLEVCFPGTMMTARQSILADVEKQHLSDFLGSWNFTIISLEASKSERLEIAACTTKPAQLVVSFPLAFLIAEKGDAAKALERYKATVAWRKEVMVDSILSMPQTHYDAIKANYTQFLHKHDKLGHPLYFEKIGSINILELKKAGITLDALFRHYIFTMEFTLKYAANQICPCDACAASETQKLCIVLDARGIGMRDMGGEVFEFVRRCTNAMQRHYPQRSFKIFIVNVPSWFGMAWKGVKPMLNEATRVKTHILTESETVATLLEYVDAKNLPVEYGGTCSCIGGCATHSSYQLLQQALVTSVLECKPFESEKFIQAVERERFGRSGPSTEDDAFTEEDSILLPPSSPKTGGIKCETSASTVSTHVYRCNSSGAEISCMLDGVDDEGFCRSIPAGYFVEEVLKAGFLLKHSLRHKQFNPIWHRRLFILHPHFLRFAKILDSEIYQIVSLTHDTIVQKSTKQNNSFEIITPLMAANGHSLLLYTPTTFVLNSWVTAISGVIDQLKFVMFSPIARVEQTCSVSSS